MMMAGDTYSQWWQDKGGFNYIKFLYDKKYAPGSNDGLQSGTGANIAKHLYGDDADHIKALEEVQASRLQISPPMYCALLMFI